MSIIDIANKVKIKKAGVIINRDDSYLGFVELKFRDTRIFYESNYCKFFFSCDKALPIEKKYDLLYGLLFLMKFHDVSKKLTSEKFIKIFEDMGIEVEKRTSKFEKQICLK